MSPFVPDLSFKHRRVTKHVRFPSRVDQIYVYQKRGDEEPLSASDFINKYWVAIIIGAAIAVILLVILVIALVKVYLKRKEAAISPKVLVKKKVDEKNSSNSINPVIVRLGSRPEPLAPNLSSNVASSAPNIMVTPASASPSKPTFASRPEEPFAYKSMDRKQANVNDPYFSPKSPVFQSPESDSDSETISEVSIKNGQVHQQFQGGLHQLALYHDQDMSRDYPHAYPDHESEVDLDEVDLRSPARTPRQELPSRPTAPIDDFRNLPRSSLASRIASMLGKRGSYNSSVDPVEEIAVHKKEVVDDAASEWTATSRHNDQALTEGELGTLALQFPPPAFSSAVRAGMPDTADKEPSEDTDNLSFPVPHFNFHHPTGFHRRQYTVPSPPMPSPTENIAMPTFGQAEPRPRPRSLSPPPPKGLRRPFELTRIASHQDLHASSGPFTSFSGTESARARAMAQRRGGIEMSRGTSSGAGSPKGYSMGRLRTVSDRYATGNLATETAMSPRKSDIGRDKSEITLEQELRNYTMSPC